MFNSLGRERFSIGSKTLEVGRQHIYLRQVVAADPNHKAAVTRRRMRWSAFRRYSQMINGSLPISLKGKVYNSCILLVLAYKAEMWRLTKGVHLKWRMVQQAIKMKIIGVMLRDKKKAEWVREQMYVNGITQKVERVDLIKFPGIMATASTGPS